MGRHRPNLDVRDDQPRAAAVADVQPERAWRKCFRFARLNLPPYMNSPNFARLAVRFTLVALAVVFLSALAASPALAATSGAAGTHAGTALAGLASAAVGLTAFDFLRAFRGDCDTLAFTAAAPLKGGTWVVVGTQIVLVQEDTATGATAVGIVETTDAGIEYPKAAGVCPVGDPVYWDADGNPVGGVAGSGAVSNTADDGANKLLGYAVELAGAGDATCRFRKVRL